MHFFLDMMHVCEPNKTSSNTYFTYAKYKV
jgi:hypothetical protein